jgi:hypothetical protein
LSHTSSSFCSGYFGYFGFRKLFAQVGLELWSVILPTSAFQVARSTGVGLWCHCGLNSGSHTCKEGALTAQATLPVNFCGGFFWDRVLWTICLGWLWTPE